MFKKIKTKFEAIRDFCREPYLEERSVGTACIQAFFEGSGYAAWGMLIALHLVLAITGTTLTAIPDTVCTRSVRMEGHWLMNRSIRAICIILVLITAKNTKIKSDEKSETGRQMSSCFLQANDRKTG
jgi:hypothetical protein